MAPIIYTGPPNPEHGGNLPEAVISAGGEPMRVVAVRELDDGTPIHGATVVLRAPTPFGEYSVAHSADDLRDWFLEGWRLGSF